MFLATEAAGLQRVEWEDTESEKRGDQARMEEGIAGICS